MAAWTPNVRKDCETIRTSTSDTYRQVPDGHLEDGQISLGGVCPTGSEDYKLSVQCSDKVHSPKDATERHLSRRLQTNGCVTVAVNDVLQAVAEVQEAGHSSAELPIVDDSECPDLPEEHVSLDFGANSERSIRRALGRSLHKHVLDRAKRDGWAYRVSAP